MSLSVWMVWTDFTVLPEGVRATTFWTGMRHCRETQALKSSTVMNWLVASTCSRCPLWAIRTWVDMVVMMGTWAIAYRLRARGEGRGTTTGYGKRATGNGGCG